MGKSRAEEPAVQGFVPSAAAWPGELFRDGWAYSIDAWQRGVLFIEVLLERSRRYREQITKFAPHTLKFAFEPILDGRKLPRPVNYVLVRVLPPPGVEVDPKRRPFVVVDPRAGHGPGIGGFKPDSEIGVAFKAGHPCYFIGFLPDPVPGQTIEDIARAEATFLEHVIAAHPEADGKPAVIGNCQAGWAVMLVAAIRPELFGPIIIAGSPLSYWAGTRWQNPMRYSGGLLGGSWLTALTADLGDGTFDGAWLVSNFENLNPANTLWTKQYNLYSKVDTEAARYLEFEQWWGGHVLLNGEEMQAIVDQLFVGNKLATVEIKASDGSLIDLRNIRSPIVVFCSKADNITPPPQALDWILDLYASTDDIRAHEQTIVYAVHESTGHLGIFVSGSVAKKEHSEFASNIDLIDVLPPGLYEAVMIPKEPGIAGADFIGGDYLVRFEERTLDDIRALGTNSEEDDRRFAAAARISEINLGLYRSFMQPWVRMCANAGTARALRDLHPLRLQYEMFSHANPLAASFSALAAEVRRNRRPVSPDNPYWLMQQHMSDWIETWLDGYRDMRDHAAEALFHTIYGAPLMQALVGLKAADGSVRRKPGKEAAHLALIARRMEELVDGMVTGGPREALVRALLYIRMPSEVIDERGFNLLRQMREKTGKGLNLAAFKELVRDQFLMLTVDERRAVEAIPAMLARDPELATELVGSVRRVIDAVGPISKGSQARLAEIEKLLKPYAGKHAAKTPDREGSASKDASAAASAKAAKRA